MDDKRLQEIKDGDWMLHGTEEWTNQEDADTEAVIKELIAAYEQAQAELTEANDLYEIADEGMNNCSKQLAEAQAELDTSQLLRDRERYRKENIDLRAQLAEAQAD